MQNISLSNQLRKVAKGTGIVFIGSVLGTLLSFFARIIIVRYITPNEFGVLSLVLVVINILVVISLFGFEYSVPRYISHAFGKEDYLRVWATIKYSIKFAFSLSIISSFILYFLVPWLLHLFNKSDLINPIRILVFTIPSLVLTNLLISILRGLEDVKAKVYFQNIFPWGIRIVLLGLVILFGLSFKGVLYTYLISGILTVIFIILYSKNIIYKFAPAVPNSAPIINKEFIVFSLPLLCTSISLVMMSWTDTLMLGYFKSADIVGLYNIALLSSRFIDLPLQAMTFIYLPVASQFFAQGRLVELKKFYSSITKWTFFITFPVILTMFFAPKAFLHLFFGTNYINANIALQLLIVSKFVETFIGPNGMTMISFGKTNIVLYSTLTSISSNIILNILLIPKYGLEGAAVASAFSLVLANFLLLIFMYKYSSIHPFNKGYLKSIGVTFVICFVLYKLNIVVEKSNIYFLLILVSFVSLGSILLTKSIDLEDILLLENIERKILSDNRLTIKLATWCKVKY